MVCQKMKVSFLRDKSVDSLSIDQDHMKNASFDPVIPDGESGLPKGGGPGVPYFSLRSFPHSFTAKFQEIQPFNPPGNELKIELVTFFSSFRLFKSDTGPK